MTMGITRTLCLGAALGLLLLPGPARSSDSGAHSDSTQTSLIGPGDVLDISVFNTPELQTHARVSDQGNIQMALIGAVHVSGLSPHDAADMIGKKLQETDTVKHPMVNVFVSESAYNRVSVLGEVKAPAAFPVVGPTRLLDVVSEAGGLLPSASGIVVVSHRDAPDKSESYVLSNPTGGSTVQDPPILPGDTVIAKKAGIVYVVGGVIHPGGFVMELDHSLSLLKALALAEGPAPGASLGKAVLLRTVDGRRQEVPVDLKALLHRKTDDMQLEADDILYVPVNSAKAGLRQGMGAITSAAAYAAIYRF